MLQTLDVLLSKGYSPISLLVRLLTSIRYGIPFRDCMSHIETAIDSEYTLSAKSSGIKRRTLSDIEKGKSDVELWRFREITANQAAVFFALADRQIGKGYAYARYFLDTLRILSFIYLISFPWWKLAGVPWKWVLRGVIFLAVLQVVSLWLRKWDKLTYDCAESVAELLHQIGLIPQLESKARNDFPNSTRSKLMTLSWYGLARKVAEYKYKRKKWHLS